MRRHVILNTVKMEGLVLADHQAKLLKRPTIGHKLWTTSTVTTHIFVQSFQMATVKVDLSTLCVLRPVFAWKEFTEIFRICTERDIVTQGKATRRWENQSKAHSWKKHSSKIVVESGLVHICFSAFLMISVIPCWLLSLNRDVSHSAMPWRNTHAMPSLWLPAAMILIKYVMYTWQII